MIFFDSLTGSVGFPPAPKRVRRPCYGKELLNNLQYGTLIRAMKNNFIKK